MVATVFTPNLHSSPGALFETGRLKNLTMSIDKFVPFLKEESEIGKILNACIPPLHFSLGLPVQIVFIRSHYYMSQLPRSSSLHT